MRLNFTVDRIPFRLHESSERFHQCFALVTDTAAYADDLRLKRIYNIDQAARYIFYVVVHNLDCRDIAFAHGVKCGSAADFALLPCNLMHNGIGIFLHSFARLADQRSGGGIRLPAAFSAAGTRFSIHHNNHMTALAAGAVYTRNDLSVYDNAGADARAERYGNKVLRAVSAARVCLAQRGAVCVIINIDRQIAEPFFQHFARGHIIKTKVVGKFDNTILIHCARCAETHGRNIRNGKPCFIHRFTADRGNIIKDLLRRTRNGSWRFAGCNYIILVIHHGGDDICAAQINSDIIHNLTFPPALNLTAARRVCGQRSINILIKIFAE